MTTAGRTSTRKSGGFVTPGAKSMEELSVQYNVVRSPNGGIMVVRLDGIPILKDEARELIRAINNTLRVNTARKLAQAERELLSRATWMFPDNYKDLRNIKPCVYFATSTARPGQIKIGQTYNLYGRRIGLQKSNPGRFRILAYIETDDHITLETALHERFRDGREKKSEWFAADPVLKFIKSFGGDV